MGWCSATEIIDTAISAADEVAARAYELLGVDPERVTLADVQPELDECIRAFVATVATKLRQEDWDCWYDSEHFDRFPQEMAGWTDTAYAEWLAEQIEGDPLNNTKHVAALAALQEKRQANGR